MNKLSIILVVYLAILDHNIRALRFLMRILFAFKTKEVQVVLERINHPIDMLQVLILQRVAPNIIMRQAASP